MDLWDLKSLWPRSNIKILCYKDIRDTLWRVHRRVLSLEIRDQKAVFKGSLFAFGLELRLSCDNETSSQIEKSHTQIANFVVPKLEKQRSGFTLTLKEGSISVHIHTLSAHQLYWVLFQDVISSHCPKNRWPSCDKTVPLTSEAPFSRSIRSHYVQLFNKSF